MTNEEIRVQCLKTPRQANGGKRIKTNHSLFVCPHSLAVNDLAWVFILRPSSFVIRTLSFRFALAALFICCLSSPGQTLSYTDLAGRLTNLEYLATLPPPGDQCALWSSYDRSSYYNTNTGAYVNWTANNDGSGIIRMEGTNSVLAEMIGPGCIWRMWSATPSSGHVRIYLDGTNGPPAVDLPFSAYFDGQHAPFTNSALVHTTPANGWNNYTPVPYLK